MLSFRLASVQEQRLPEARISPTLDETPPVTPTSGKVINIYVHDYVLMLYFLNFVILV